MSDLKNKYSKCPKCGAPTEYCYDPSEQEYPGAAIWPEYHHWQCTKCSWDHGQSGSCIEGRVNTRGW